MTRTERGEDIYPFFINKKSYTKHEHIRWLKFSRFHTFVWSSSQDKKKT